jgi:glycosyltransferase involved in cell wall biosynthesis
VFRRIRTAKRLVKNYGFPYTLNYSISWAIERFGRSWRTGRHLNEVYDLAIEIPVIYDFPGLTNIHDSNLSDEKVKVTASSPLVWFVPAWTNVWGGGHFTIFRFANYLSKKRKNIIFVYDNQERFSAKSFQTTFDAPFPQNTLEVVIDPLKLPKDMIPIATTWQSVFSLLQYSSNNSKRFYFMQDYESLFYAHGTQSMQALASYEQGLIGITGGPWLLSKFVEHGGNGMNYMFTVDHDVFFPKQMPSEKVERIFFYGRPSTERRCFELGIASLKLIKERYPDIEIVIAGLDGIGDVGFDVTLLGSVPLPKLGELYRSCDIGLALSGTNLSYLPVELMACGVPVVSNSGPQVEWYCEDGVNSLVVSPFPTHIADAISRLISDSSLRASLIQGGIQSSLRSSWDSEANKIEDFIESQV